jgi:hypothetical protein
MYMRLWRIWMYWLSEVFRKEPRISGQRIRPI